jgi:hypothetical protein
MSGNIEFRQRPRAASRGIGRASTYHPPFPHAQIFPIHVDILADLRRAKRNLARVIARLQAVSPISERQIRHQPHLAADFS